MLFPVVLEPVQIICYLQSVSIMFEIVYTFLFEMVFIQSKSNLSLYLLYYTKACNEFAGSIFASLRPGNSASLEEMLKWWQAVGNTVFELMAVDLNLRPFAPETSALLLN